MSNPIRSMLEGLMKDAIANRKADDPPQGRQMLLDQAEAALTAYVEEEKEKIRAEERKETSKMMKLGMAKLSEGKNK